MRGLTKWLLASVFVLITAGSANARTITLKQAVEGALRTSPNLKMAMHKVNAATYAAKAALRDMLPKIKLSANYYRMGPIPTFSFDVPASSPLANMLKGMDTSSKIGEANNFNFTSQVVQPLTPLFSLYQVKKMREIDSRAAIIDRETARETVKLNVKTLYYTLLQMLQTKGALKGSLKSLGEHLNQVQALMQAGVANQVDELRVKVRIGEVRSAIAQLDGQYRATLAMFNALIGLPRDDATQLKEPEHRETKLKALNAYRDAALGHRLELAGIRSRLKEAKHGVTLAKTAFIPQGSIFAQYGYQYGNDFIPEWSWQVGIGLQWQWEWWKNGYLMDQAKAQAAQLRESEEALKQGVLAQVDQAYYAVKANQKKLEYWKISVKQARDVFRLTEDRYKAGTVTNTDVLDAQSALIGARASYFAALYGLMTSLETLHEAVYGALSTGGAGQGGSGTQQQPPADSSQDNMQQSPVGASQYNMQEMR